MNNEEWKMEKLNTPAASFILLLLCALCVSAFQSPIPNRQSDEVGPDCKLPVTIRQAIARPHSVEELLAFERLFAPFG